MKDILKNLPDIITAAAASNLGIVALMLIVLSGLAYVFFRKSKEIWRFSALVLLLIGCMSFGFAVFRSVTEIHYEQSEIGLSRSIDNLVKEAEAAHSANTIYSGDILPVSLLDARNKFESTWKQASLIQRKEQDAEKTSKALSYLGRLYRVIENDSSLQKNANFWVDEAIHYFEETQNRKFLTEALLDKAGIYLDIAQLGNNDRRQFESMARDGDAVMTRAYQTSDENQRPSVLRISSRFYYNLARPKSFRLSDAWDNNYLLLAYQKAATAYELNPHDIKNANQLMRTVIKVSKNPPQDSEREWTSKLRDTQQKFKTALLSNQTKLVGLDQRLSPLNVFGVSTVEAIAREWLELTPIDRRSRAKNYIDELDSDALSPLREAAALLQNSGLRQSHGFDLYYDIGRAEALKTVILRSISAKRAANEFNEVRANLLTAKENAKTSQLEAAVRDIGIENTFRLLTLEEKNMLHKVLSVGIN